MAIDDWGRYHNFKKSEFDCKFSGENNMQPEFMERLQDLRTEFSKPMTITSGYRSANHPEERKKKEPGAHSSGRACDISVAGSDALTLITLAVKHGFTGIGVAQKGTGRFIHLDDLPASDRFPRPTIWSY